MLYRIHILLIFTFLITACTPAADPTILPVTATIELLPTWTPLPSSTSTSLPTETETQIPTSTSTLYIYPLETTATLTPTLTSTLALIPTSTDIPSKIATIPVSICDCSRDYNCKDFTTQSKAQACFNSCGGSNTYNWSQLDGNDRDGKVCESLP